VRLAGAWPGRGYGARSFLACSRALPSVGSTPRNRSFHFNHNPGAAPCGRRAAQNRTSAPKNKNPKKSSELIGQNARVYWA